MQDAQEFINSGNTDQNTMSHDSVIRQLPVDSHVLGVWQGGGRGSVHWRRVRSSGHHEQVAPRRHHVTVQHLVDQSSAKGKKSKIKKTFM